MSKKPVDSRLSERATNPAGNSIPRAGPGGLQPLDGFHRIPIPALVELYRRSKPFLCALALCLGPARSADCADPIIPEEEYAVVAAVLEHGLSQQSATIVIADTTTGVPTAISRGSEDLGALALSLELPASAIADWMTKNERRFVLTKSLPTEKPYDLITSENLFMLFKDADPVINWEQFYQHHPKTPGLVRVSRVGFDPAHAHAVVYVEFECGAACGSGRLVHLSHDGSGRWQVLSGELLWVAADKP